MISDEDIARWNRIAASAKSPTLISTETLRRLLAERELLVAEHNAFSSVRKDPTYDSAADAWLAVEDFS